MNRLFFVASVLASVSLGAAVAAPEASRFWSVGDEARGFVWVAEKAWLSEGCANSKNCQAYGALREKVKLDVTFLNGRNPASTVCKEKWQAKVVIARYGDETQGFCVFPDNSAVSLGGLLK